jgi:YD repeat-containing protein
VLADAVEIAANRIAVTRQAVDPALNPLGLLVQERRRLGQAVRVDRDLAGVVEEREDAADDVRGEPGVERPRICCTSSTVPGP